MFRNISNGSESKSDGNMYCYSMEVRERERKGEREGKRGREGGEGERGKKRYGK